MTTNVFAPLLGKYIREIAVEAENQSALRFTLGYGHIYVGTSSDCFSETWFADIIGTENLLDQEVIGIRILDLPTPTDDRTRQEEDKAYGVRLTTCKGDCDIIYRNSSNGYYGGSAEPMSAEIGEKAPWLNITADWQA